MEQNKDKLFSWQERHYTVWRQVKRIYNIDRPTKYCVVFNTYTNSVKSFSITPFDTLDEALEEAKLINIVYSPTLRPKKIYKRYYSYRHSRTRDFEYDFSDGSYFWGYMILDMANCKIIKLVNTVKMPSHVFSGKITLNDIDVLFRREDEVPDDYIWDARGEYDGWLQFRWGDKKNALDYVEPPKKERPGVDEIWEIYDEATDSYIKRKVRVVYVNWDDPLPKPEKGIKYLRPNKEPVRFPGSDIGFENDYSLQEWALSEEIASEEYLNNGGTFKPESTSNSLADMLGDKNPLLKLLKK